jgi:hypothetical protein
MRRGFLTLHLPWVPSKDDKEQEEVTKAKDAESGSQTATADQVENEEPPLLD